MNLTATKFCLENAREAAGYAKRAYTDTPTIIDAKTDTQVLILDLGDCIVVAFPGTHSLRDFITDAEVWRADTEFGAIHWGFGAAWNSVAEAIHQALGKLPARPVILVGHSLGGSLAILGAKILRSWNVNIHSVYTFGAPRVGDKTFQQRYNATPMPGSPFATLGEATFTLINDCDIVPRIPSWLAGYRRPGRDEFIPFRGGAIIEDPPLLLRLASDIGSLWSEWYAKRGWLTVEEIIIDHHIDNYIRALAALPEPETRNSELGTRNPEPETP